MWLVGLVGLVGLVRLCYVSVDKLKSILCMCVCVCGGSREWENKEE